jgi:cysteine synthase A
LGWQTIGVTATSALESTLDATALQEQLGLADKIVDAKSLENSVRRFAEQKIVLPTFGELAEPHRIPASRTAGVDKNAADPRNLFRVHWYNNLEGDKVEVPDHVVLPSSITGIESPIIVVFGDRFPMITAHKVLAAYSCFVPRVITGQFDPTRHRAVWPSTGNYARGGIAISTLMGSRGVAVLPAGMSQERFDWLDKWVSDPSDIVRTAGTESNVKEIYDACNEMAKDPGNLFRVHWYNNLDGDKVEVPDHVVLPSSITGIESPIIVVFGDRFPMITAHKVLAAYSCFVPRVITGQFDPTRHRAVWPSTGNYARGGIAISTLMGSRGVAVLPAGMSQERFDWLDKWVSDPSDIVRTAGTESNVKEIYDACNEMAKDPGNFILNQFCEFGNHAGHYEVTGRALAHAFEHVKASGFSDIRLAAFTSATGSAGTIAAGDRLKDIYGTKIVAVEALECPTMLENGFGEHNIQGIGDKHIPLIHNVMNTDVVVGVTDRATDELDVLFNTPVGQQYLSQRHGISADLLEALTHFGFSAICNVIAAIKTAKLLGYGANDAIVTIATDGSALYPSERVKTMAQRFKNNFTEIDAAEVFSEHLGNVSTDGTMDCTALDKNRIFNLGYYTWVEQQGTPFEVFEARRSQSFWRSVRAYTPVWDELINEFNARVAKIS